MQLRKLLYKYHAGSRGVPVRTRPAPRKPNSSSSSSTLRHVIAAAVYAPTVAETAREPTVADIQQAMAALGAEFFAPPLIVDGSEARQLDVPFLTQRAGALPVKPRCLDHSLYMYGSYASKYVSVRVQNVHVKLSSWEHAVQSLRQAEAAGQPYWCSLLEDVVHPDWWPSSGHVPQYDQVIFGRGNASIGLHFDKDNVCAGGSRTPVSTYLAICEGCKLTLLLPPDQTLLPAGGDPELLLRPSRQLLEDVRAAGGYFFLLQDEPVAAASGLGSSSSGGGSGGAGDNTGFSATALYMPAGWYHWLVGLTDWHVVYGGSFYPDRQQQQQQW